MCAAVEHWLGHHEAAHDRLIRAWDELPAGDGPEAAALLVELAVDAMYRSDYARGRRSRRPGRWRSRRRSAPPRRRSAAAAALTLAEAAQGHAARRRGAPRRWRSRRSTQLSDTELAPHLEALYNLCWAENYLEHYDTAVARADRGARHRARDRRRADARAAHAGQGVPVRDAGAHGRDDRAVRDRARGGAARAQPALPLLGAVRARLGPLLRGRPGRRDRRLRGERRARPPHARRDDALDRRRPGLGARDRAARGRRARARRGDPLPGRRRGRWSTWCRWSAASTGRSSCCSSSSAATSRAPRRTRPRARPTRRGSASGCPATLAKRGRAAVQLAQGDHAAAAASARASAQDADAIGAGLQAAYSAAAARPGPRGGRRARRGGRGAARGRAGARRVRVRSARATRRAGSCGAWAHGRRCAGPATRASPASTR